MKTHSSQKNYGPAAAGDRKPQASRQGSKLFSHRYERRKIRAQLRHLDWALAGADW